MQISLRVQKRTRTLKLKLEEMDTVTFVNNLPFGIDKNKVITDTVDNLVSTALPPPNFGPRVARHLPGENRINRRPAR